MYSGHLELGRCLLPILIRAQGHSPKWLFVPHIMLLVPCDACNLMRFHNSKHLSIVTVLLLLGSWIPQGQRWGSSECPS